MFRASKRARSTTSCRTLARAISASTPTWKEKLSTPPASSYMHWPLTASKPCSSQARLLSHRLGRQRMFPERPSRRCIFEAHRVARELKSAGDQQKSGEPQWLPCAACPLQSVSGAAASALSTRWPQILRSWATRRQPPYAARSLSRVRSRGLCYVHARALDAPALHSAMVASTGGVSL